MSEAEKVCKANEQCCAKTEEAKQSKEEAGYLLQCALIYLLELLIQHLGHCLAHLKETQNTSYGHQLCRIG